MQERDTLITKLRFVEVCPDVHPDHRISGLQAELQRCQQRLQTVESSFEQVTAKSREGQSGNATLSPQRAVVDTPPPDSPSPPRSLSPPCVAIVREARLRFDRCWPVLDGCAATVAV